ncbi:MAG: glycosyltransferase [Alphaproteobacteria bacterium]
MSEVTILQVVPRLDSGGSEQSTIEIADALSRAGATALVASEGGRLVQRLKDVGGEFIPLPLASKNPLTILSNARRLAGIVDARNVSLLHARSRAPAWSAFISARRTGRLFVTTYHGSYSGRTPLKTFYSGVMARGDCVIANSRYTARLIALRHQVPQDRMRVIYRGIDLSAFAHDKIDPARLERLRMEWGVREGQPIVVHAARLTSWKGQPYVIEAARRIRAADKLGDAVFVLAGDEQGRDAYRHRLEQQITEAGLEDRVRLVGHCEDIPAAFALGTIAVIASTSAETFGRTSIESQAAGCPVIITDVGAAPENVVPASSGSNFTGWVVPPADSAALAASLTEALALSSEARRAIGARARAHVSRHFTLKKMQAETLAVYDDLIGTKLASQL